MKPELIAQYVEPGTVFFEYRDYAFLGNESRRAAEAAYCAADQNKFWNFHNSVFENQGSRHDGGAYSDARLRAIAEQTGLDLAAYDACMASDAPAQAVQAMIDEAQGSGVNSTPSLFVNGQKIDWQGWDGLKAAIDAALASGAAANATPAGDGTPAP